MIETFNSLRIRSIFSTSSFFSFIAAIVFLFIVRILDKLLRFQKIVTVIFELINR